jgi:CheY-like chemotaxis protein
MREILLVEDSRFLRVATERAMVKAGYAVVAASDGEEALQVATIRVPDLIVLDMLLPKLSGPDVLRSLKKNIRTAHIPVVVCSGLSQKNEDKLRKEGACAFIEKSSLLDGAEQLLEIIETTLRSHTPPEPQADCN